VGGDEIQKGKPAPDIFLAAANRLHVPAERCIVLEDSEVGVQAAQDAGMLPIMIPDLKPPSEKSVLLAHKILPSLYELKSFLGQLFGAPA
jgi:beta-phosphoglucomutase-like phosphatase (HAD superfamily)